MLGQQVPCGNGKLKGKGKPSWRKRRQEREREKKGRKQAKNTTATNAEKSFREGRAKRGALATPALLCGL